MSEWISVKDRLPEAGTLIVYANDYASGTQYGVLRVPSWDRPGRYDYWMPIPEPPKEN